jgi:RAB protein geranylgeranyltransferase component A
MQAAGWITAAKMAVCKVPTTDKEAMMSNLMGLFEKKRVANMFKFVQTVNPDDKTTW